MAVAICKDESVLVDERRDESKVRGVSCSKGQSGFDLFELGQVFFELHVRSHVPGNESRRPSPDPPLFDCLDGRLFDGWMVGQSEVIIRGHGNELAAFDGDGGI